MMNRTYLSLFVMASLSSFPRYDLFTLEETLATVFCLHQNQINYQRYL